MDYRKKHNGRLTLHDHWDFLKMALAVSAFALFAFPVFSHLRLLVTPNGVNISGTFSRDNGSVYWSVLSKPGTNQMQFVLLLPVTTAIDWGNDGDWAADANDYCHLQVKSNRHQWKIEDIMDGKTGFRTMKLHDVTANTTNVLNLHDSRFWQLDDAGRATQLKTIDVAMLARIAEEIKENETNFQAPQENSGD